MWRFSFALLICFSLFGTLKQTIDVNLRQLQFVSDHLTPKECGLLLAALHEHKFQVDSHKLKPVKDDEPCLMHLVDWNKETGDDATVEDLTLPLHQIGRADIARMLAKAVHDNTNHELHKFFLDDPFKKMAASHGPSQILAEDEEQTENGRGPLREVPDRAIKYRPFALAVFGFTVTLLTAVVFVCLFYCRTACATLCPKSCVTVFVAVRESCQETVADLKRLANKHVMGREEERVPLTQEKTPEHIVEDIMRV